MFKSFHFNRMDAEGSFPNGTNEDKPEDLDDLFSRMCEEFSVRTNSKFWNEPNTEYLFNSKNLTNRIPSNYSFLIDSS